MGLPNFVSSRVILVTGLLLAIASGKALVVPSGIENGNKCVGEGTELPVCARLRTYDLVIKGTIILVISEFQSNNTFINVYVNDVFKGPADTVNTLIRVTTPLPNDPCSVDAMTTIGSSHLLALRRVGNIFKANCCGPNIPWTMIDDEQEAGLKDGSALVCVGNSSDSTRTLSIASECTGISDCDKCIPNGCVWYPTLAVCAKTCNLRNTTCYRNTKRCQLPIPVTEKKPPTHEECARLKSCGLCSIKKCFWSDKAGECGSTCPQNEKCFSSLNQCNGQEDPPTLMLGQCSNQTDCATCTSYYAFNKCTWHPENKTCSVDCALKNVSCYRSQEFCAGPAQEVTKPRPKRPFCYGFNVCSDCISEGCTWQPEAEQCTSNCQISGVSCLRDQCSGLPKKICNNATNCLSCLGQGCTWQPILNTCTENCAVRDSACYTGKGQCSQATPLDIPPPPPTGKLCPKVRKCSECVEKGCAWEPEFGDCVPNCQVDITCLLSKNQCPIPPSPEACANHTQCNTCTNRGCTWQQELGKMGECTPECARKRATCNYKTWQCPPVKDEIPPESCSTITSCKQCTESNCTWQLGVDSFQCTSNCDYSSQKENQPCLRNSENCPVTTSIKTLTVVIPGVTTVPIAPSVIAQASSLLSALSAVIPTKSSLNVVIPGVTTVSMAPAFSKLPVSTPRTTRTIIRTTRTIIRTTRTIFAGDAKPTPTLNSAWSMFVVPSVASSSASDVSAFTMTPLKCTAATNCNACLGLYGCTWQPASIVFKCLPSCLLK
eukprot:Ihof_evm5s299 gene=Ihof_evmTU5s299